MAYRARLPGRLGAARTEIAAALDTEMREAWIAGDESLSNVAVAKACGVDERIVRRWRDGERSLPVGALLVMPATLAQRIVARLQDRRALSPHRRGLPQLRAAIERLAEPVADDDRREVLRALLDAQRRIGDVIAALAGGDR